MTTVARRLATCVVVGGVAAGTALEPRVALVVVGLLVLAVGIARPAVGVFLLAVLAVTRASLVLEELHDLPSFVVPYALVLIGAELARRWSRPGLGARGLLDRARDGHLVLPIALGAVYCLVLLTGVLHSARPDVVWSETGGTVKELAAVGALLMLVRTPTVLRAAVWGAIAGAAVLAVVNAAQHLAGSFDHTAFGFARPVFDDDPRRLYFRIGGSTGDPNYFAQTLVVATALAFERARNERTRVLRSIAAAAAAATIVTIVLTTSRGGWIALAVVIGLFLWDVRPRATTVVALLSCVVLLVAFAPDRYRAPVTGAIDRVLGRDAPEDGSIDLRADQIRIGVQMFREHPVLGVGAGQYPDRFLSYARSLDVRLADRTRRVPHAAPVEVAAETGVVGLGAFGAIVVGAFVAVGSARRRMRRRARPRADVGLLDGVRLALWGFVVTALFLALAFPQVLWFLVGLAFAAPAVARAAPESTDVAGARPRVPVPA